jgi:hypothetical protein
MVCTRLPFLNSILCSTYPVPSLHFPEYFVRLLKCLHWCLSHLKCTLNLARFRTTTVSDVIRPMMIRPRMPFASIYQRSMGGTRLDCRFHVTKRSDRDADTQRASSSHSVLEDLLHSRMVKPLSHIAGKCRLLTSSFQGKGHQLNMELSKYR